MRGECFDADSKRTEALGRGEPCALRGTEEWRRRNTDAEIPTRNYMKERLFLHSSANLCETSAPSAVRICSFRQSTLRDPSKADNNRNRFLTAENAEDRRGLKIAPHMRFREHAPGWSVTVPSILLAPAMARCYRSWKRVRNNEIALRLREDMPARRHHHILFALGRQAIRERRRVRCEWQMILP